MIVIMLASPDQVTAHDRPSTQEIKAMLDRGVKCQAIVRQYLQHLERTDQPSGLNAISSVIPNVLDRAGEIDARLGKGKAVRPLECVPIAVKDNIDVAGLATTAGSSALADNVAQTDAPVVQRLVAAGAIILAKTNMAEWAFSPKRTISSTKGETANPYNIKYVPAGSSGGTAAAVASGFAAAGLGSDTGNSVRGPAAHTGLVGLRPGVNIVPIDGVVPLFAAFDVVGPMTLGAYDSAVLMDVLANNAGAWKNNYVRKLNRYSLKGKTFAVLNDLANPADADPEALDIFERAIKKLRKRGAMIVRIDLKPIQALLDADTYCASFRSDVRKYLIRNGNKARLRDPIEAFAAGNYAPQSHDQFAYFTSADSDNCPSYADSRSRQAIAKGLEALLDTHEAAAFIYPSWTYPVARRDRAEEDYKGDNSQVLAPSSGLPAITFPSGHYRNGLPAGLQMLGRRGSEADLVSFAYGFESEQRKLQHIHPSIYRPLVQP
jgi:Asp-tRNA(Asn)/Glu-tRNA(Gln) amidotransferase A subunit family amidase